LVASYDLQSGNTADLFSKEKISEEKLKKKGKANAIHIAQKSRNVLRVQYSPEPVRCKKPRKNWLILGSARKTAR